MNKGLLALNGALGVAVIILFYLHFSGKQAENQVAITTNGETTSVVSNDGTDSLNQYLSLDSNIAVKPIKIAYVDSDSLDKNLKMLKDVKKAIETKEKSLIGRVESKKKQFQASFQAKIKAFENKRNEYSVKAPTYTDQQAQAELQTLQKMEQELGGLEQQYQMQLMQFQQKVEQELMTLQGQQMADYYGKVQEFCQTIANRLGFDFILIYQKGGAILHASNTFDISKYVIDAINKEYDSKQPAK